jgi:hypothetical protein
MSLDSLRLSVMKSSIAALEEGGDFLPQARLVPRGLIIALNHFWTCEILGAQKLN